MGATGAVTQIDRRGRQYRIATGLASFANRATSGSAIGPHGITVVGAKTVIVTNGGPTAPTFVENGPPIPNPREWLAAQNKTAHLFGRVLLLGHRGRPLKLADVCRFENTVNPDRGARDSNPVDVLFDGHRLAVADAGGNFVATANPRTGAQKVVAGGFTNIMDLAFDRHGTLYVLEIDHDGLLGGAGEGAILTVDRKGKRRVPLPAGSLPLPGGIAVGDDGLYVTTNAVAAGGGQVVRIRTR